MLLWTFTWFLRNLVNDWVFLHQFDEYILVERVYHDFLISVNHKSIMDDLIELCIVDFDAILGMNWIHTCYTLINCWTRIVKLISKLAILWMEKQFSSA